MIMNREEREKKVKEAVQSCLRMNGYVCAVDLLLALGILKKKDYENWRAGRVDFLERVCSGNLSQLRDIISLMRTYALQLKLKQSATAYHSWGKGAKRPLRFSRSGERRVEELYATHFIDTVRISELKEEKKGRF